MGDATTASSLRPAAPSYLAVENFFELLGKACSAAPQRCYLRAAEYYGRAASSARALWGEKGALCVAHLLLQQSYQLAFHSQTSDAATWLEAQRMLAECFPIVNARLSANTCLVGRCFAVEEDFFARYGAIMLDGAALDAKVKARLQRKKLEVGYDTCIQVAMQGLEFAYPGLSFGPAFIPLTGEVRKEAQAFVLRCVGIMATATPSDSQPSEHELARTIRCLLTSDHLELPFKAKLARVWDRPAVQNALRARGVFQIEELHANLDKTLHETMEKKAAADRAKHGLRWCALPSCAKQETHVFDFKACSACKAVVYCSAEHGALHWTRGHRKECAALKAIGAKPRSTADEGGAAA